MYNEHVKELVGSFQKERVLYLRLSVSVFYFLLCFTDKWPQGLGFSIQSIDRLQQLYISQVCMVVHLYSEKYRTALTNQYLYQFTRSTYPRVYTVKPVYKGHSDTQNPWTSVSYMLMVGDYFWAFPSGF